MATGQYTKREVLRRATDAGLRTRRDRPLSPQTFGNMLRNRIHIGQIESPDCGVSARGDFEPLIDETTFYRAQAVLDGRVTVAAPRQRNHPDFPLRGFVRCETCGRPLTGSWSRGRNGRYAYYHCPRRCRTVNVSKAALEGAFVDELALLQPTPGYMRVVKDRVLYVWEQRSAEARERTAEQERRVKYIRERLDRRNRSTSPAFAERILPRASDMWVGEHVCGRSASVLRPERERQLAQAVAGLDSEAVRQRVQLTMRAA